MGTKDLASVSGGFPWNGRRQSLARQIAPPRGPDWPASMDPRIRHLEMLMRRDLHRPFRLGDLAAGMQISASHLSHLFSTQTGVSPKRYLKAIRLRRAGELLEGSSLSVKEVAARVGLDVSRFIKEFRETYGVTPAQHRRLMRLRDLTGVQSAPAPETGRARTTE